MSLATPRVVFVTREDDYEQLLARHATREQARFALRARGQRLEETEARHDRFRAVLREARATVPDDWRQAMVHRADLDRFLFGPEDIIVAVGQDGLVANVAKYLSGQPVLGVNPAPDRYDGVLVRLAPSQLPAVLARTPHGDVRTERRTMAEGVLDNGERLLALNELFVGHRSHQSARYRISVGGLAEDQSSSGLIVATGTGATGWARSIMEATQVALPIGIEERSVAYFVREPFPSVATGTTLRAGKLGGDALAVESRMNDGGVIFADGIEQDFLGFDWGRTLTVRPAERALLLVTG